MKGHKISRLVSQYNLVIIVSLLWFMVQFLRFTFPPLFETFQSIYGVSNTDTGVMFTLMMVAYSIVQFPAGIIGDRLGRPLVMLVGTSVFAASALLTAGSPSFIAIAIFAVLIGLGTGPHKAVAIPLLSNQYTDQTGRALGVMDTIGQFGGMAAPLVAVAFVSVFIWQGVFILSSAISIFLGILLIFVIKKSDTISFHISTTNKTESEMKIYDMYKSVFKSRKVVMFAGVTMLFTFAWNGLSSFFPLFLISEKGLSTSTASISYSLLFVASLSQAVTGDLSDKVGRLQVGTLLFVVIFVGVIALLVVENILLLIILSLIIGIGFHGFRPVRDSYLMDIIPDSVSGGALGIIRTLMTGVGALSPALVGFLSDIAGFNVAFGMMGGVAAIGLLMILSLQCFTLRSVS